MRLFTLAALGLLTATAACAPTPPTMISAKAAGVPLESGKFLLAGTGVGDVAPAFIEFSPGDHGTSVVSGSAGCNRFNGGYTQTPTTMSFKPIMSSMMMCEDAKMANERKLLGALQGVVRYHLDASGVLTLTAADNSVLTFQKQ